MAVRKPIVMVDGIRKPLSNGDTVEGLVTTDEFNTALSGKSEEGHDHDGVYATPSDVTTAITNLINAAPTALNDLNELAAALGDDQNFAATMTTALAGKATPADIAAAVATLQSLLVSAVNIKTINSQSVLGSGNLVVSGAQPDIVLSKNSPDASQIIPTGYSGYIPGGYEIRAGVELEISSGACFEIA